MAAKGPWLWRCSRCGEDFDFLAAWERHVAAAGHYRCHLVPRPSTTH